MRPQKLFSTLMLLKLKSFVDGLVYNYFESLGKTLYIYIQRPP